MARILTARELSTVQMVSIRDAAKEKLLDYAVRESGKARKDFCVRDAMPLTDFGLGTELWDNNATLVAGTWSNDWSKQLPKTKYVAFYGIVNRSTDPQVIGTKFKVGQSGQTTRDVVMHGRMLAEDTPKCFFETIIYKGDEWIYIEHYNGSTSNLNAGDELIELQALVAELYGDMISGPLPY